MLFYLYCRNIGAKFYFHAPGQFLDLSGRMGHKIFPGQRLTTQVKYLDFYQLERTLENHTKSCLYHVYDDCMYSVLSTLMKSDTIDNCTVPWIRDNDNICTKPEDINTAFWIAWHRVTNQRKDCDSPCHRLIIDLGAKEILDSANNKTSTLMLYFPQKMLVNKEHYLYTLLTLLAEIGGYMGLLLGYSLFNIATLVNHIIDGHIEKHRAMMESSNTSNKTVRKESNE